MNFVRKGLSSRFYESIRDFRFLWWIGCLCTILHRRREVFSCKKMGIRAAAKTEKLGSHSSTRARWFTRAPVLIHCNADEKVFSGHNSTRACWLTRAPVLIHCVGIKMGFLGTIQHGPCWFTRAPVLIPCFVKKTCFLDTFPHGQCCFTRAPVLNLLCWFLNYVFRACC